MLARKSNAAPTDSAMNGRHTCCRSATHPFSRAMRLCRGEPCSVESAAAAAEPQGAADKLQHKDSGNIRQRQSLRHKDSGNIRQRQRLRHKKAVEAHDSGTVSPALNQLAWLLSGRAKSPSPVSGVYVRLPGPCAIHFSSNNRFAARFPSGIGCSSSATHCSGPAARAAGSETATKGGERSTVAVRLSANRLAANASAALRNSAATF